MLYKTLARLPRRALNLRLDVISMEFFVLKKFATFGIALRPRAYFDPQQLLVIDFS